MTEAFEDKEDVTTFETKIALVQTELMLHEPSRVSINIPIYNQILHVLARGLVKCMPFTPVKL